MIEQHIKEHIDKIMDTGEMGAFFRGELGCIGCDNSLDWINVATGVITKLTEGINTVVENNMK